MSRVFKPKVVTANALIEGDAVWLTASGTWTRDMRRAELIKDEAQAAIRLQVGEAQHDQIVGVYLVEAKAGPEGPEPVHFREEFRTRGPSNYPHGKQVETTKVGA